jgi:hypothetical protein
MIGKMLKKLLAAGFCYKLRASKLSTEEAVSTEESRVLQKPLILQELPQEQPFHQ